MTEWPTWDRVAVLSDIHGVLPALDAVLAEPAVRAAGRIVCLGDVAAGPQPAAVMRRLMALGDRVIWVGGNADREMVEYRDGLRPVLDDPVSRWAARQLDGDQLRRLRDQPLSVILRVGQLGATLFCHASPRGDEEAMLVDRRPEEWSELFADVPATTRTILCGHTHMPFARLAAGRMVVNPGSVGMPYGRDGAHWVLLGPGVEFRRTALDVEAVCAGVIAGSSFPDVANWVDDAIRHPATDVVALAAFGVNRGRTG